MPTRRLMLACALVCGPLVGTGASHGAESYAVARGASKLTHVAYDAERGAIVVQFSGPLPRHYLSRLATAPCTYLDFVAPSSLGLTTGTAPGLPFVRSWVLARRSATMTRLSLNFNRPAHARVEREPAKNRIVIFPYAHGQAAAPVATREAPEATPAPTAAPTIAPVAECEAPHRPKALPSAPSPRPDGASTEPRFRLSASLGVLQYRESNLPGDAQVQVQGLVAPGMSLDFKWPTTNDPFWLVPDWRGSLQMATLSYAFQDRDLPVSIHARQEWRGEALLSRRLGSPNLYADLGLGYLLRYETAAHSGTLPQPSYLFSKLRLFHGPQLAAGLGWRLGDDWPVYLRGAQFYGQAAVSPWIGSVLDAGLPALPPLMGGRAEYGLDHRIGPVGVRAAYRWWWTGSFGGYEELLQGPVVTITSPATSW